ncbi:hypothetical protein ACUHGC_11270 [Testudinibacter sp. P27/CKL/0425]
MDKLSPIGSNWNELEETIFSEQEVRESDLRVALIGESIREQQESKCSQNKAEIKSHN